MTTTKNTEARNLDRIGITGAISLDRRSMGRVTRDEYRAIMTAHAAKITAELPAGLVVNRLGEMFQAKGGMVGFNEFHDMLTAAHAKLA